MKLAAGIDIGNDSVKLILNGTSEPIIIPSVVSPGYERHVLQEEDSPLKALDVMVYSPKLKQKNQRCFVGQLAFEDPDNAELEDSDNKAASDQALIAALTALAYAHLAGSSYMMQPGETTSVAEYVSGTGLPVRTFARYHQLLESILPKQRPA